MSQNNNPESTPVTEPQTERPDFAFLSWSPNYDPKIPMGMLDAGVKAFVVEGYHSGTLPAVPKDHPDWEKSSLPFLEKARASNVPVFLIFRDFPLGGQFGDYEFDSFDNLDGMYETSTRIVNAGIVPLKVKGEEKGTEVLKKLREILQRTTDPEELTQEMYSTFGFKPTLAQMREYAHQHQQDE